MTEQQIIYWIGQRRKAQPKETLAKLAGDFLAANRITVNDPDFTSTRRAVARIRANGFDATPYAWRDGLENN